LCMTQADTKRDKAKADIDLNKKTLEATNQANKTKNESDYDLAIKKCANQSSTTKGNCEDNAKRRYHP